MYENAYPKKRFEKTLDFLNKHLDKTANILDLGVENPLSKLMIEEGYKVQNTIGEDLDENFDSLQNKDYDVLTAFEILEHLLNPYSVLKNCKANKVFISIPLRLWFATAYRSKIDKWDRHYHEFEDWQLDWLLEKSGFKIVDSIKWAHPVNKFGIRPLLRKFTPRYYLVYAERI